MSTMLDPLSRFAKAPATGNDKCSVLLNGIAIDVVPSRYMNIIHMKLKNHRLQSKAARGSVFAIKNPASKAGSAKETNHAP